MRHLQEMRRGPLVAALTLVAALAGCRPATDPARKEGHSGPLRLTHVEQEKQRHAEPKDLPLPLDAPLQGSQAALQRTPEGLQVTVESAQGALHCPVWVDSAQYNTLRIHMKVDQGAWATMSWSNPYSPEPPTSPEAPSVQWRIRPGDTFQTYSVPLVSDLCSTWAGSIDHIALFPSDGPAEAVVAGVELLFVPPESPQRVTIGNVTMEALPGTPSRSWTFEVPPDAVLETAVGLYEHKSAEPQGGAARFRVWLDRGVLHRKALLIERSIEAKEGEADRQWALARASLRAFAGESITLRFSVDELGTPLGDYAYWGNPLVYTPEADEDAIPVVLVSCDTLRADHLSCYGYRRKTTPNLDQWAREEAVLFENAITPETYTLPAHMSVFTGLYPKNHGVTPDTNLAEPVETLSEVLQRAGYLTAGFTSHGWWLEPWRGFSQGFDHYDGSPEMFRPLAQTAQRLSAWIEGHTLPAQFLFFHNYDIHFKIKEQGYALPYESGDDRFRTFSAPLRTSGVFTGGKKTSLKASELLEAYKEGSITFTQQEHDLIVAGYDDCVQMVDQGVAGLFEELKTRGLYERALIIVMSDHGESLNERGYYDHLDVWEEECRVPLLIKFPSGEWGGTRFAPQVELIDLYPTICAVLGLPPAPQADGQDLLGLLRGSSQPRDYSYVRNGGARLAVRTNTWKLHWRLIQEQGAYRLFDLEQDPGEVSDRYGHASVPAVALRKAMNRFHRLSTEGWHIEILAPEEHPWRGSLDIQSSQPIQTCNRFDRWGNMTRVSRTSEYRVEAALDHRPPDRILLKTSAGTGRITVAIEGNGPFRVQTGQAPAQEVASWRQELDPSTAAYDEPPRPAEPEAPTILIWYVAPKTGGSEAPDISPDLADQLKALGYLDKAEPKVPPAAKKEADR